MNELQEKIKNYLIQDLNVSIKENELNIGTPLLSSRLIDSISALLLVEFLEKTFNIQFKPHEVSHENLDSIQKMEKYIGDKQGVSA
jgi:acyl carrier protein